MSVSGKWMIRYVQLPSTFGRSRISMSAPVCVGRCLAYGRWLGSAYRLNNASASASIAVSTAYTLQTTRIGVLMIRHCRLAYHECLGAYKAPQVDTSFGAFLFSAHLLWFAAMPG
jgi:hypothetical protein